MVAKFVAFGTFLVRSEILSMDHLSISLFDAFSATVPVALLIAGEASGIGHVEHLSAKVTAKCIAVGNFRLTSSIALLLVSRSEELYGVALAAF